MRNIYLIAFLILFVQCNTRNVTNVQKTPEVINKSDVGDNSSTEFHIQVLSGESHNHPSFVFWLENKSGEFIETLFITKSVGTATYAYGDNKEGTWQSGTRIYPASLPYWSHKRGVKNSFGSYIPGPDTPLPDAITGATPSNNFRLIVDSSDELPREFYLLMEVNQTWDFNEFWTNSKFPNDKDYQVSCQPSLIYRSKIDMSESGEKHVLKPVGHGHHSGDNGSLNSDLSTLTSALDIFKKVTVEIE